MVKITQPTQSNKVQFRNIQSLNSNLNHMKREKEISKAFGTVLLIFFLGFMPYGIIRGFDKNNGLHPDIYIFLTLLFIMAISISPLIFGVLNKQIKGQCIVLIRSIFKMNLSNGLSADENTRLSMNQKTNL